MKGLSLLEEGEKLYSNNEDPLLASIIKPEDDR